MVFATTVSEIKKCTSQQKPNQIKIKKKEEKKTNQNFSKPIKCSNTTTRNGLFGTKVYHNKTTSTGAQNLYFTKLHGNRTDYYSLKLF